VQASRKDVTSVGETATVFLLVVAACASGCRQLETPAAAGDPLAVTQLRDTPASAANDTSTQTTTVYRIAEDDPEAVSAADDRFLPMDCKILPPGKPDQLLLADGVDVSLRPGDAIRFVKADSPDLSLGESGTLSAGAANGAPQTLSTSGETHDGSDRGRFHAILASTCDDVWHDYGNYYSRSTAIQFAAVLAPAAVLANTNLDANFATWYQTHIRSTETNHVSDFFRPLGNGYYTIPVYVSAKFVGEYFDDVPGMGLLGEWGDRTTRALLVGAPPLLAVQYVLGAGRPSDYVDQSYWKPFHSSHGASGHAFMGAVPFLTLAGMTDDPFAKCFFYACSPWTGMTRINDSVHYLSQVWLGWWMAYLACESVNKTENQKGPMVLTPLVTPEMTGVGVVYEH
jgi:hypothetical protein